MRHEVRRAVAILVFAAAPASAGDADPVTPAEAATRTRPLLEAACKATPAKDRDSLAYRDNAKGILAALEFLKPHTKKGLEDPEFAAQWNLAVSLGHFHNLNGHPAYRLESHCLQSQPIHFSLPSGRGWVHRVLHPSTGQQQCGSITRTLPDGRVAREIRIHRYLWSTVYSGVGGENAKELGERAMKGDRETFASVSFRSNQIVTARLSRGFPKTSYYEIVGDLKGEGPARVRDYYVKGVTTTWCIEVIERRQTAEKDDAWTRWQVEGDDPELAAILESFEEHQGKH